MPDKTTAAVDAFNALRRKLAPATLVDMNKTLIYDDVGITPMEHALQLCAAHFELGAQKINVSSSVNFISTLLHKTPLVHMLNWNTTGQGIVQKPDTVFAVEYTTPGGTQQTLLIYYESDAGSKDNDKDKRQAMHKLYQSTCGCRELNPDLPAISVRANVFVGPAQDEHLDAGSAELTKVQRSAQNALTFLHELALGTCGSAARCVCCCRARAASSTWPPRPTRPSASTCISSSGTSTGRACHTCSSSGPCTCTST